MHDGKLPLAGASKRGPTPIHLKLKEEFQYAGILIEDRFQAHVSMQSGTVIAMVSPDRIVTVIISKR